MSDFAISWQLSRKRFADELAGLDEEQLRWRIHPGVLSLGEMALHVAGVEVSFASQLLDLPLDDRASRLRMAATEGVVNDSPFPFDEEQITPEMVSESLEIARALVEPIINAPTDEIRAKEIKSALGPMIDGSGALARLGFHAGYHQGQAHLIKTAPGFPR